MRKVTNVTKVVRKVTNVTKDGFAPKADGLKRENTADGSNSINLVLS